MNSGGGWGGRGGYGADINLYEGDINSALFRNVIGAGGGGSAGSYNSKGIDGESTNSNWCYKGPEYIDTDDCSKNVYVEGSAGGTSGKTILEEGYYGNKGVGSSIYGDTDMNKNYGGGGGGCTSARVKPNNCNKVRTKGDNGAVRIVWQGRNKSFPNKNIQKK